jgi:hypothetical protein
LTRIRVPTGSRSSTLQAVWNGRALGESEDVIVVKGDNHSPKMSRDRYTAHGMGCALKPSLPS